jgi:hypothetical protein
VQAMIRRLRAAIVIVAGLALPLATAGTASAGSAPPPGVGCNGVGCAVSLEQFIHFSGNWSAGTSNPVTIPPPPCLWEPIGGARTGSQQIVDEWGPVPPTTFGINKSYQQAQQLLKQNPPPGGTWYLLPINPAASAAGKAECLKLPLYAWVLPGQLPPTPPIPPSTLRLLALAKLTRPGIGNIDINPAGLNYANLPTFVRVNLTGAFEKTAAGRPYATVTASLPDGALSVTVWAMARPLSIGAGTPDATLYTGGCGYLGSTATARQMSGTGANQPIDCGVTYLRPSTGYDLTASIGWQTYWAITTGDGPGPLPPEPGMQLLNNGQLQASTAGRQVQVGEIQSLNGGG